MRRPLTAVAALSLLAALSACAKQPSKPVVVDDAPLQTEVITLPMPGKTVEVEGHGEEKFLAVGALDGLTKDRPANGVVTMHVFEDTATIVGVSINIKVPDDGSFYEAWAAGADGVPAVSLGHLTNPFSDVRHSVRFEGMTDLHQYSTVVVTLEPDDGNASASSVIVAKAVLKPHTR